MPRAYRALHVSASDGSFSLRPVDDPRVMGPVDFAWRLGDAGGVHTVIGSGPIAGSFVPGSNRLVVVGRSPLWERFFPSTMGGAGLPWDGLGANFVAISGRAASPSVLLLRNVQGRLAVEIHPVDAETVWRGFAGEIGVYALMAQVLAEHGVGWRVARVLAVGPAAARTKAGAIASAPIRNGEISPVDTWAGRGGLGSRLYAAHGIVAVAFGGDYEDEDLTDRKMVDGLFDARFGKPLKLVNLEKTTKYRFNPKFKTGGTFGSNYHSLKERMLSFNYASVLSSDAERLALWERLVEKHYLAQFDAEIVAERKNYNCGEPCAAVCKKVHGRFKKDYEPYQTLGPLLGVFDQRSAEELNHLADAAGFDGIQIGGELAWLMECLAAGHLGEKETGIRERPAWKPEELDPVAGSEHNAAIAKRLFHWLLDDERAAPARGGLRAAARWLGGPAAELAVYNASGDGDGCLVPNQYWVPGMFAPVPILGRYYTDYGAEWRPPAELGKAAAGRFPKELLLDNYGMCRFHRGWAEQMLPEIVNKFFGEPGNAEAHHRALAVELSADNPARPWQTERVIDIIRRYLEKLKVDGVKDAALDAWVDRFGRDKREAARAYWQEIKDGFDEAIRG